MHLKISKLWLRSLQCKIQNYRNIETKFKINLVYGRYHYTLTECLAIAITVESTIKTEKLSKSFLQNVNKPNTTDVNEVNKYKRQNQNRSGSRGQRFNHNSSHKGGEGQGKCSNCGNNHPPRKCPVYGKECFRCKKPNHFKEFCRSNPQNQSQS